MPGADYFLPTINFPNQPSAPAVAALVVPPPTDCPTAFPGLQIRFPGSSFQIGSAMNELQSGCDILDKVQTAMQSVMTILKPIFDLIDLIQKIIDCVTAIPDAIANANPDPVIQCIPGLAAKLAEILAYLFPPISVPPMISDILCVIKTIAECILNIVDSIFELEAKLEAIANLILEKGYTFLQSAYDAGNICRTSLLENLAGSTKPIQPLISLANQIAALVPDFPAIPNLQELTGLPLDEVRATVEQFRTILGTIPDTCVIGAVA